MGVKRIVKDDTTYIVFSEIYHRLEEPRAKRKAFAILEAAITCFAKKGFDATTLEMIARESGVTRPLIRHYFSSANELRELAVKYIRVLFQKLAIESLEKGATPADRLAHYVDSCFNWLETFRNHAIMWQAFLHRSTKNARDRGLNTEAQIAGQERIASLIEEGVRYGEFKCEDPKVAAKLIQAMINGALTIAVSENLPDTKAFRRATVDACVGLARG